MFPEPANQKIDENQIDFTEREFVSYVRAQLSQTMGEIAMRNSRIQENDAYIYGDLLERMLDIPIGHDRTNVNWLRRAVEIHRAQFMGRGFTVGSTYSTQDEDNVPIDPQTGQPDPQAQQRLKIENDKRKQFAEKRRQLVEAVMRDNNGFSFFADGAENASAIGDFIIKAWYDEDQGKYRFAPVEAVEHCYALWKKDDFREWDLFAYVYQISKDEAEKVYNVGPDVQTSPLGLPLAVLSTANTIEYISTQPMVTIMEVTGIAQGWGTQNGKIVRRDVGRENPINAVIVGTKVHKLIDDPKKMPKYYKLPNKRQRRRPWGMPDISKQAVNINITYIEAFSDWREVAAKVRFPKFKYLGFPFGSQLPAMQPRKAEGIPLIEGQDIQPLEMPNSAALGERGYPVQLEELKNEFVREVGIGRMLFDAPDVPLNSARALQQSAFKTISDITTTKQQLWEPIMVKMFDDMLQTLSEYDDSIKDLVQDDEDWHFKIQWPSMLNQDDPAWHAMQLNRFNAGLISIQSYLESIGINAREEIDRIKDELSDKTMAAIHGRIVAMLAEWQLMPPDHIPPKVNVNLRGDLTPGQEANVAAMHGFENGPVVGPSMGPQGELGIRAFDDYVNQGMTTGQPYNTGLPIQRSPNGQTMPLGNPNTNNQGQPEQITTEGQNTPGTQPMSQPGSGAPATSAKGKLSQHNQRRGR